MLPLLKFRFVDTIQSYEVMSLISAVIVRIISLDNSINTGVRYPPYFGPIHNPRRYSAIA